MGGRRSEIVNSVVCFVKEKIKLVGHIAARNPWIFAFLVVLALSLTWVVGNRANQVPIPVWVAVLTAFIGFIGVYMAAHPPAPQEKQKKWCYKISFSLLAAIIVILTLGLPRKNGHRSCVTH